MPPKPRPLIDGKFFCIEHKEWLPAEDFGKDARAKNKHKSFCKKCSASRVKRYKKTRDITHLRKKALRLSILEFLEANPQIELDFKRKYMYNLQPLLEKNHKKLLDTYMKRSGSLQAISQDRRIIYKV